MAQKKIVTATIDQTVVDSLRKEAEAFGISLSSLIEHFIEEKGTKLHPFCEGVEGNEPRSNTTNVSIRLSENVIYYISSACEEWDRSFSWTLTYILRHRYEAL